MTTAVIVQARTGSTRLPGKVLLTLGGDSVLRHVLVRCGAIPGVDVVCCAIPRSDAGSRLAEEAAKAGAEIVCGDETDVLARYRDAASTLGADVVMRVTSDCPLIDPEICGRVLQALGDQGVDYACNNMPRGWPHGLDCEAFTREALEKAAATADAPYDREHVTPWLRRASGIRRAHVAGPGGAAAEGRWTLDHPEDYAFFQALFARLRPLPHIAGFAEVAGILAVHPEIAALNAARHEAAPREIAS